MNETRQGSEAVTTSQATEQSDVQATVTDNAGDLYQESGLDTTQDTLRTSHLKAGNQQATNNLVARMLWGHEEKVNLNMRVSEDGSLDLNDDVR
ncbi:conserved hypothetical protein [uncultured Sporomusa sp.]|uniref:Uncharacterized protein n=1 Tax=uncultured Sporomusa sp. TaxID=307249 RepID=A0A212LV32_9FIRM|nr:hypothetical protein [uncultured Sporomusa sp.]SCM81484.1 conserved hypothetical protein [uncultured Sporomusa sp.]